MEINNPPDVNNNTDCNSDDVTEQVERSPSQPQLIREYLLPIQAIIESPDRRELLAQYYRDQRV